VRVNFSYIMAVSLTVLYVRFQAQQRFEHCVSSAQLLWQNEAF